LIVPISALLYSVGVALFVFYHFHADRLHSLSSNNAIVPYFAVQELPTGISGLVIAAIFAASMAVMSAGINSLTTATTVDFYQRVFRKNETPEHYARAGRAGTLIWGVFVTMLALFAERAGDLAVAYTRVSSVISGPMLGIFLLGTMTKRATALGTMTGGIAGVLAVLTVITRTEWSFFYLGLIGVTTTFAFGLAASLLTPAPGIEQIHGLVIGDGPVAPPATARL
jgi:Na+/proline symporter